MIKSMARSSLLSPQIYRSMLVGNSGFIPITPATYLPGQGRATTSSQINKMPYSTETFSTLSATLTFSSSSVAAFNSRVNGYALATGASTNKFNMSTDTNASFSNTNPQMFTNGVGQVPDTSGIYVTNTTTSAGGTVLYTWVYATDTTSNSTALQAHAANFGISGTFALNTNGTNVYFGGGTPAGSYVYGGFIKYASTTATSTLTYSDTNPNSRSATPGANNGSTAGYLAGGIKMPYTTITSEIRKLTYSTEVITALSGTLTTLRDWVTTGIQYGVCAYYGGGRATSGSAAVSVTTVEKFSFATETSANLASASINRDGFNSWNTL